MESSLLVVWSNVPQSKVLANLSPVLKSVPDLPIQVVKDFSVPEGTSLILALGSQAHKRLQEVNAIAKNKAITSCRTVPVMHGGVPVLISYSPDICDIDHGYYVDLLTDVSLGVRYLLKGTWHPVYGKYRYVGDFSEAVAAIETKFKETGKPVDISKDLETLGLDPYALPTMSPPYPGAYIVSMQLCHEIGTADVVRFSSRQHEHDMLYTPMFREHVEFLLNSPMVRLKGANFKYDLHWLWKRGEFTCKTFTFDTTIVGSLLDENRSNSLNVHTRIYVPTMAGYSDTFDREVDKGRMDQVPPEKLLPYAGGDVDANLQAAGVMKAALLRDPQLTSFYVNILHPAARAFEWIEHGGMVVDLDAYKELQSDLEKEHTRLVKDTCKILGGRVVAKHQDSSKPGGMNLTKASMLCDFMFSPMGLNLKPKMFTPKPDKDGVRKPSTAMEHLSMFSEVPEAKAFIALIEEDGSVMKTYTTYVVGFRKHIRSDGRFHPTYFLYVGDKEEDEGGARTGRLSCKAPAFQTVPKHTKWAKRIRRCFPAPPGYVVVERDYSQGELRVIACIANESNMLQAYREGKDLHAQTAGPFRGYDYAAMMKLKITDKELFDAIRQLGKAGGFGLVFGMGWEGFQIYARNNYGVNLSDEEAQKFRTEFFQRYPRLVDYHVEYKKIAHRDKQVRTPLGRIRHLPLIDSPAREFVAKAERQAINSVVQGTLTDMVLWTIAIEHQSGLSKIAPCFGACHDSIDNYVPEDQVDTLLPQMLEIMENLPFGKVGWTPQLKFLADGKYGPSMGEMTDFKRV